MKKIKLILAIILLTNMGMKAQINLVGAASSQKIGTYLVKMVSGEVVETRKLLIR